MSNFDLLAACDNACNYVRTIKRATARVQGDGRLWLRGSRLPQTLCIALQLCETGHFIAIIVRSRICPWDLSSGTNSYNKSPFVPVEMLRGAYQGERSAAWPTCECVSSQQHIQHGKLDLQSLNHSLQGMLAISPYNHPPQVRPHPGNKLPWQEHGSLRYNLASVM